MHNADVLSQCGHDRSYDLEPVAGWCDWHTQAQFDAQQSRSSQLDVESTMNTDMSRVSAPSEDRSVGHAGGVDSEYLMAQKLTELPPRPGGAGPSM